MRRRNIKSSVSSLTILWLPAVLTPVFLIFSCSKAPLEPAGDLKSDFSYTIFIESLSKSGVRFRLDSRKPHSPSSEFVVPFHYYDNPLDQFSASLVENLIVVGAGGDTLDTTSRIEKIGPVSNIVFAVPQAQYPISISYTINPDVIVRDTSVPYTPLIAIDSSSLYLVGAYVFIVPFVSTSLVDTWRTPVFYNVETRLPPGLTLYGLQRETQCFTTYELLFLQMSAGIEPLRVVRADGFDFALINHTGSALSEELVTTTSINLAAVLKKVSSLFGSFGSGTYTVGFHTIKGGLEGTFSFTTHEPNSDTMRMYGMVLAHEALHHFIGIRCGDYDDPWWKESVTMYLGQKIAVNLGIFAKSAFQKSILEQVDFSDPKYAIALSDPQFRERSFADRIHGLAYNKGAQAAMLMDHAVIRSSSGTSSLENVTAALTSKFMHSAFRRSDFIDAFRSSGAAAQIASILETFVDKPGITISDSVLNRTFRELDSLGAF